MGKKIDGLTVLNLLAVMFFPSNEEKRKQFIAKNLQAGKVAGQKSGSFVEVGEDVTEKAYRQDLDQCGGEEILLNAPNYKEIWNKTSKPFQNGFAAGMVLLTILRLDKCLGGGSLNRASHFLEVQLKDWGIPNSPETIKRAWKDYKSVSHLWAACNTFMGSPGDWLPAKPEEITSMLGVAETFQRFGENHNPGWSKGSTLNPHEMWAIPDGFPVEPVTKVTIDPFTEEEKKIIDKYEAPKDNREVIN